MDVVNAEQVRMPYAHLHASVIGLLMAVRLSAVIHHPCLRRG
jgi:hypothetical protein